MRVQIVGVERSAGTSMKSGSAKPYSMATLHAIIKLDEQNVDDGKRVAKSKGFMGASYRVSPELVQKIEHNSFPLVADLVVEDVMRFNKRETNILEVRPVERVVQPVQKAA